MSTWSHLFLVYHLILLRVKRQSIWDWEVGEKFSFISVDLLHKNGTVWTLAEIWKPKPQLSQQILLITLLCWNKKIWALHEHTTFFILKSSSPLAYALKAKLIEECLFRSSICINAFLCGPSTLANAKQDLGSRPEE